MEFVVERMREGGTFKDIINVEEAAFKKSIEAFYPYMNITLRMRLFRTDGSLLGMGPRSISDGDEAWVLQGSRVPFILRSSQDTGRYQLLGQGYVHGMMHGEALVEGEPAWMDIEIS